MILRAQHISETIKSPTNKKTDEEYPW